MQTPSLADRPLMDRWIISELNLLVQEVDAALEDFDSQIAGRALARFIDDLSNWYVRRSRDRFKGDDEKAEKVYTGVKALSADDVAETIYWSATLPSHMNINVLEVMPVQQAFNAFNVHRGEL